MASSRFRCSGGRRRSASAWRSERGRETCSAWSSARGCELLLGLALGLLLAWPAARLLGSLLVGVDPQDPPTFLGVALVLTAVSLLACWFPARRASRTDPVAAIRYD